MTIAIEPMVNAGAAKVKVLDDGAGYRHITLEPHPERKMGFAKAAIETKYGKLMSAWHYNGNEIRYDFSIPEGVTAELTLPGGLKKTLTAGEHLFVERV